MDTYPMEPNPKEKVREPIVEGLLYPADPTALKDLLIQYGVSIPESSGSSLGILTPHAAYDRCGILIARAFRAVEKRQIVRAILIGPVHRDEEDAIYLPESTCFQTPLGNVPVDEEAVEALFSSGTRFLKNDIPHLEEHCLEIQLPFLTYHFPGVKILPILMGKPSTSNVQLLSHALKSLFSSQWDKTLFLITSNGSLISTPEETEKDADRFLDVIQKADWKTLLQERSAHRIGACGTGGVATILHLFGSSIQFTPLGRVFSADEKTGKGMVYISFRIDQK
ncbi:MAG: AmmeMemoRadiSam system protein B [Spirochaetes bacterium]|nr:AmmeMemoRadiSam system protein B [Spirochaetota bacterium]